MALDNEGKFARFVFGLRYRFAHFLYRTFRYRSRFAPFLFVDEDDYVGWGNSSDSYAEWRRFDELSRVSLMRHPDRAYYILSKFRAYAYSKLSFQQALAVTPKLPTILLALALGARFDLVTGVIGRAFAAEPSRFTPPLGLSQGVYSTIVLMFTGVLLGSLGLMSWAGFVAKPKNQGAATAVTHLVTFVAGVLLGGKV